MSTIDHVTIRAGDRDSITHVGNYALSCKFIQADCARSPTRPVPPMQACTKSAMLKQLRA